MLRLPSFLVLLLLAGTGGAQVPSVERILDPGPGLPRMELHVPPRAEVFALGAKLFSDPVLSRDRQVTCRSCHLPEHGFSHPEPFPPGIDGRRAKKHAPVLINRGYGRSQRWDGSVATLEEFVLQPIEDPDEMGFTVDGALERLRKDEALAAEFSAAFEDGVTRANLAASLAIFVRGIIAEESRYDRFLRGDIPALSPDERMGFWLFESKAGCWQCHTPPLFSDEGFHNTGVGAASGTPEPGRAGHTGKETDLGRFKTPTLRGVSRSAPFMHDGSEAALEAVIEFYDRAGNPNPNLDPLMKPLGLTVEEKARLLAFLRVL